MIPRPFHSLFPSPSIFTAAALLAAALLPASPCAATDAPGLLAEYFDFVDTPLTDFPDLTGLVPDAVLAAASKGVER